MAATNDTSFPERNKGWYPEDLTEVNEPIRKLLEDYTKLPSGEVVKHVNEIVSNPRSAKVGVSLQQSGGGSRCLNDSSEGNPQSSMIVIVSSMLSDIRL